SIEYKDVIGFPGYRVGDDGTVWSCRPINGKGAKFGEWRQKIPSRVNRLGHLRVDLYCGKDERHLRYVHRLVLEAFVGPCPNGMEACHNDGNPSNNVLSNLRWDTRKANQEDTFKHGTANIGERNHQAKLSIDAVREIRAAPCTAKEMPAVKYGVSRGTIND